MENVKLHNVLLHSQHKVCNGTGLTGYSVWMRAEVGLWEVLTDGHYRGNAANITLEDYFEASLAAATHGTETDITLTPSIITTTPPADLMLVAAHLLHQTHFFTLHHITFT